MRNKHFEFAIKQNSISIFFHYEKHRFLNRIIRLLCFQKYHVKLESLEFLKW